MRIRSDWHIHTRHSPCGKPEATMELIRRQAAEAGIETLGVSDHLHCHLSEPAVLASRREYDALADRDGVLFGLEVSCLRRYDVAENERRGEDGSLYGYLPGGPADDELAIHLPAELVERVRPAYVIAGVHWPLDAPPEREAVIRQYHRQYVFLAGHPDVDVVAHPWWWATPHHWDVTWRDEDGVYNSLPWFDDFGAIPRSMHDELAAAAREHGTAIEINAGAFFANRSYPDRFKRQYCEYLAYLKDAGVTFAMGSDSHAPGYAADRAAHLQRVADELGLDEGDLWRPDGAA